MISIYYFVKSSRQTLMARVRYAGKPITDISTGIKIGAKKFDFKAMRFHPSEIEANKAMNNFEATIYERFNITVKTYGENPPSDLVIQALKTKSKDKIRLSDVTLEWMVGEYRSRLLKGLIFNQKTGRPLAPASIKTLVETCDLFMRFIGDGHNFNFSKYNLSTAAVLGKPLVQNHYTTFVNEFKTWIINRGVSDYTVFKTVYKLKQMIRYMLEAEGIEFGDLLKDLKFKKVNKDVEVLTPEQIRFFIDNYQMIREDCQTKEQVNTLDYIVIGLLIGARRSDMNNWDRHNLYLSEDSINMLKFKPQKTASSSGVTVDVPVPDMAMRIFENNIMRHGGKLMPPLSSSINKRVKAIAKRYPIFHGEVQIFRKGRYIKTKLYDTLHIHMMRSSSTSDKLMSMPEAVVKEWTGHTHDSEAFARYVKVSQRAKVDFAKEYFRKLKAS